MKSAVGSACRNAMFTYRPNVERIFLLHITFANIIIVFYTVVYYEITLYYSFLRKKVKK